MIRSSIFVCVMTVAVFCLQRFYEMTKHDPRDHVSCHPLLLFVENSLGICSPSQKISRLFAFGSKEFRLSAVQALITSPHDVSKDHVKYLVDIISDSESAHEIAVAITSLSHITDGRLDIAQEIMRHRSISQVFSKLFQLNDSSWWPVLHNLFLRLASAVRTPSDISHLFESDIINSVIKQLKHVTANTPTIQQAGALQFLAVASSHVLIAAHIYENQSLMDLLKEFSQQQHLSGIFGEGPVFASQILENIHHFHSGTQDAQNERRKFAEMDKEHRVHNDTIDHSTVEFNTADMMDEMSNVIVETDGTTFIIDPSELEKMDGLCDTEECMIKVDSASTTNIFQRDINSSPNIDNIPTAAQLDGDKIRRKKSPKKRHVFNENGESNSKKTRPKRKPVNSFATEENRGENETRPRSRRRKQAALD